MDGYLSIHVERLADQGVVLVTLDRPRGNVLDPAMMQELTQALAHHAADPTLKAVVLRGAGGHFSFGASVEDHRRDRVAAMLTAFHGLVRRIAAYPVPIVALVEGKCLGGAFEVVLACHLVVATADASFACPEIKLGVFPPVLAAIGAQRLGGALAERLLLTGSTLDAAAAERAGLVAEVLQGEVWPAALQWIGVRLGGLSAFSLRQAVRAARQGSGLLDALGAGLDAAEQQYLSELVPSHDGNEGIEAFLERRPAAWRNA